MAAAGFDGVLREDTKQPFATPRSYDELLDAIVERVEVAQQRADADPVHRHQRRRARRLSPQEIRLAANLPFLDGKKLGQDLSQRLDADCVLVHDAHALCLAEYVYGEAQQPR